MARRMKPRPYSHAVSAASVLAVLTAVLLVGSRYLRPLAYVVLPLCLPGVCILGLDETQERFGRWGEIILFWLTSLPCLVLYAASICRWWLKRRGEDPEAEG